MGLARLRLLLYILFASFPFDPAIAQSFDGSGPADVSRLAAAQAGVATTTTASDVETVPSDAGAEAEAESRDPARPQEARLEEIIVTGVPTSRVTQFESSVAISTFSDYDIRESAPASITDLYLDIPGVWAETSGGDSAANIFVRGIPAPGQYRFTKLQVDGMPTLEESGIPFLPPESYLKLDPMIARVEAVRGGASTIFASNAAGGIINNITRKGSEQYEGYGELEWADYGQYRLGGFVSGPLSDRLRFASGGFYRISDGVRDPGFTANEGGQFRTNLTYDLPDGELNVYGSYINDRTIFYLPIPLDLDGGSLTSLPGLDANTGTLTSDDVRIARVPLPNTVEEYDLQDGIHTNSFAAGGTLDYTIGEWTLSNKSRVVFGETRFNAIFSVFGVEDSQSYLTDDDRLAAARAAFPGTESLVLRFSQDGVGNESTFVPANDGVGGNNGNGLVVESGWWSVDSQVQNFQNDFRLTRAFEAFGKHAVTLGLYGSFASYDQRWQWNNILQEVGNSPRTLDVYAVDGAGTVVGAVTQNGFTQYGTLYRNFSSDVRTLALYAAEEWQATSALRFDAGLRIESLRINGQSETPESFDLSDDNPLISAGDLQTLADDAVLAGSGVFVPFDENYTEFAWSVGVNYTATDYIAFFARANDAFRTPDPNDLAANPSGAGDLPVNDVFQAEGGVKVDLRFLKVFATVFFSNLTDQIFSDPVLDEQGNSVEAQVLLNSETLGVEAELTAGPFFGFSLKARATFQDPEITGFEVVGGGFGVVGEEFIGNEVQRIAKRIISLRPRYDFLTAFFDGSVFVDIYNVGDRFANNGNSIVLPGYTTLGAGLTLNYNQIELTVVGDNLTNTIGVTEGNPRTDAFRSGDSSIATFARPILGRNFRVMLGYRL